MKRTAKQVLAVGSVLLAIGASAAQTQSDTNRDACSQCKQADQALNGTYSNLLKDYAKDAQFIAKLKQAQRSSAAFRDANLAARFPKVDKQAEYCSAYPTCRCAVLTEMTQQRTKELKVWAEGVPEDDVCNGSVKTAQFEKLRPEGSVHECGKAPDL